MQGNNNQITDVFQVPDKRADTQLQKIKGKSLKKKNSDKTLKPLTIIASALSGWKG